MNIFKAIFGNENVLTKGMGVIDQLVTDKDKAIELKAAFYLQELRTPTIPLIDAFHKMGRQFLAYGQMIFYFVIVQRYGVEAITPELVAGVSGAANMYTLIKGKGK